jgi:hypothetical protein
MKIIFVLHMLSTFFSFGIALFQQAVHFPLLRYIGPYQYPIYYEKQQMKLALLTFPVYSLEVFTSIVLMVTFFSGGGEMTAAKENSFFTYLSTIILLLLIHLITFYFIKPILKKLTTKWEEKTLKELLMYNMARLVGWAARLFILIYIVVNPA